MPKSRKEEGLMDWIKHIGEAALTIPSNPEEGGRHEAFVRLVAQHESLSSEPEQTAFVTALGQIIEHGEDVRVVAPCVWLAAKQNLQQLRPIVEQLERSGRFAADPEARGEVLYAVSAFLGLSTLEGHSRHIR